MPHEVGKASPPAQGGSPPQVSQASAMWGRPVQCDIKGVMMRSRPSAQTNTNPEAAVSSHESGALAVCLQAASSNHAATRGTDTQTGTQWAQMSEGRAASKEVTGSLCNSHSPSAAWKVPTTTALPLGIPRKPQPESGIGSLASRQCQGPSPLILTLRDAKQLTPTLTLGTGGVSRTRNRISTAEKHSVSQWEIGQVTDRCQSRKDLPVDIADMQAILERGNKIR